MSQCPYCETTLEPATLGTRPVDCCPACGGAWVSAGVLTQVLREQPAALAPFDDAHRDHGGAPPLTADGEHCAGCGAPLAPRTFPIAPDLPVLACAACKHLFFRDGELRALHERVSPETLPAEPELPPVGDEQPVPPSVLRHAFDGLGLWWSPRTDGQGLLSWLVLGMPWWLVLLLVAGAGAATSAAARALASSIGLESMLPPLFTVYAYAGIFIYWPLQTLLLAGALAIVWWLGEGAPPEGFLEIYLGLLRVTAVGNAVGWTLRYLFIAAGMTTMWLPAFLIGTITRLVIYHAVLELEWREAKNLTVLGWFIPGGSVGV